MFDVRRHTFVLYSNVSDPSKGGGLNCIGSPHRLKDELIKFREIGRAEARFHTVIKCMLVT